MSIQKLWAQMLGGRYADAINPCYEEFYRFVQKTLGLSRRLEWMDGERFFQEDRR